MHSKHVIGTKKTHFLPHLCFTMNVLMVTYFPFPTPDITLFA